MVLQTKISQTKPGVFMHGLFALAFLDAVCCIDRSCTLRSWGDAAYAMQQCPEPLLGESAMNVGKPPYNCTAFPTSPQFDKQGGYQFKDCYGNPSPDITCPPAPKAGEKHVKILSEEHKKDGCAACPQGWVATTHWLGIDSVTCGPIPKKPQTLCRPVELTNYKVGAATKDPSSCYTVGPLSTKTKEKFEVNGTTYAFQFHFWCNIIKHTLCADVTTFQQYTASGVPGSKPHNKTVTERRCGSSKHFTFDKIIVDFYEKQPAGGENVKTKVGLVAMSSADAISPKEMPLAAAETMKGRLKKFPTDVLQVYMNQAWPVLKGYDSEYGVCSGLAQNS